MSAILAVENLEKSFGSVVAARDINVSIPAEQTIGVIGANGAGKTTFINMITGHLTPTKGTIRFEDRDITGMASRDITRLGISRSFQVAQVFPTMTVLDNMCIAAAIARRRGGLFGAIATPLRSPDAPKSGNSRTPSSAANVRIGAVTWAYKLAGQGMAKIK